MKNIQKQELLLEFAVKVRGLTDRLYVEVLESQVGLFSIKRGLPIVVGINECLDYVGISSKIDI